VKPHDPTFISFDSVPSCEGLTDKQTGGGAESRSIIA